MLHEEWNGQVFKKLNSHIFSYVKLIQIQRKNVAKLRYSPKSDMWICNVITTQISTDRCDLWISWSTYTTLRPIFAIDSSTHCNAFALSHKILFLLPAAEHRRIILLKQSLENNNIWMQHVILIVMQMSWDRQKQGNFIKILKMSHQWMQQRRENSKCKLFSAFCHWSVCSYHYLQAIVYYFIDVWVNFLDQPSSDRGRKSKGGTEGEV